MVVYIRIHYCVIRRWQWCQLALTLSLYRELVVSILPDPGMSSPSTAQRRVFATLLCGCFPLPCSPSANASRYGMPGDTYRVAYAVRIHISMHNNVIIYRIELVRWPYSERVIERGEGAKAKTNMLFVAPDCANSSRHVRHFIMKIFTLAVSQSLPSLPLPLCTSSPSFGLIQLWTFGMRPRSDIINYAASPHTFPDRIQKTIAAFCSRHGDRSGEFLIGSDLERSALTGQWWAGRDTEDRNRLKHRRRERSLVEPLLFFCRAIFRWVRFV